MDSERVHQRDSPEPLLCCMGANFHVQQRVFACTYEFRSWKDHLASDETHPQVCLLRKRFSIWSLIKLYQP